MTATLRLTSPPEMGPGGRHLVLDCLHGTTYLDQLVPPRGSRVILSERAMIALAVEKHEAEEGCGCARDLTGGQSADSLKVSARADSASVTGS